MGVVRIKPGVTFDTDGYGRKSAPAPGGIRIVAAIDAVAKSLDHDVTITSVCDGLHSGPEDPHPLGNAVDVRTHDLVDPQKFLAELKFELGPAFYAFIEDPGEPNEHIHAQVSKGTVFPPVV